MKKSMKIILLILGIICILLGGILSVYNFIESYKLDQKNTKEIVSKIVVETQQFEEKIEEYNSSLTQFIKLLNESTYYEKIQKNNGEMVNLLNTITEQIKEIDSFETSKKQCLKKFVDGKVSRACNSYAATYEKSINIYIDVVKAYNNLIVNYNNLVSTDEDIKTYDSIFNDYIDYNNDSEYSGKNTTNEGNLEYEKK